VIATGAIAYPEWQERIAGTRMQLATMETTIRTDAYPKKRVLCSRALTLVGVLCVRNVCLGNVLKSCYNFGLAEGWTANILWTCD
jgi:hypothetical protein